MGGWAYVRLSYEAAQNWSSYEFLNIYVYGTNSVNLMRPFIFDTAGNSIRWDVPDNFVGWREIVLSLKDPGMENGIFDPAIVSNISIYQYTAGVTYIDRIVLDGGQAIFIVNVNPDPAKIGQVTIDATASETLSAEPNVTITQNGGTPITVAMSLVSGNTYTGPYTVVAGYDGTTEVNVSGYDLASNLISSQTFF